MDTPLKKIKIQIRRDSAANWHVFNPILRYKELCCVVEDENYYWKIGDGTTPFKDLPYVDTINAIEHFMVYGAGCCITGDVDLVPSFEK